MPLFTLAQVQSTLTNYLATTTGTHHLEVFTNFPSNERQIAEGFYAARAYQAERLKNANGITPGGHIYSIKDKIEMYVVTQQDSPYVENQLGIFQQFIDDPLFKDYFLREHTIEQQYIKNSEQYKIIFDLTRLQVI
jgi:hypothetical protein